MPLVPWKNAYFRALVKAGVTRVKIFDTTSKRLVMTGSNVISRGVNKYFMSSLASKVVSERLLNFLSGNNYNFEVIIVFKGANFSRKTLERGRKLSPKTTWVNINPDDPLNVSSRGSTNKNIVESLGFFNLYCVWSKRLVEKLANQGCQKTVYLPFGYDQDFHLPPPDSLTVRHGLVTFVGAWDKEREAILSAIADYDLHIYGNGWNRVSRSSPLRSKIMSQNIYREEFARVIARSTVSLNLLRSQNIGSHNMRTFEIPAMGGLMLTTRSEEQDGFFPEGKASLNVLRFRRIKREA